MKKIIIPILIFNLWACSEAKNVVTNIKPIFTLPKVSLGIVSDTSDVTVATKSGIVLMGGGTDVDEAMQ